MMIDILRQENLQDYIEHQTFDSGELIVLETDYYWLLHQGAVKSCTWTEEGTAITLGYWGMNDLIGQPLSLVYPYHVRCLTEVKAGRIPISQTDKIIHLIQHHIQQTEEILYILRSDKAHQRLCRILIWLGQKFGQEVEIGKLIDLRLTHQDLAELVGTTRVTITKLINQLEQEHFLSRPQRNTIIIHS
jgi:CRP-like cAMP-binding protein